MRVLLLASSSLARRGHPFKVKIVHTPLAYVVEA